MGLWQGSIKLGASLHWGPVHGLPHVFGGNDEAQPTSALESDVVLGITHHKTGEQGRLGGCSFRGAPFGFAVAQTFSGRSWPSSSYQCSHLL